MTICHSDRPCPEAGLRSHAASSLRPRRLIISAIAILVVSLVPAGAQRPPPSLWDIEMGAPIRALPLNDFLEPACGSNGGPPGRPLRSFDEFALCAPEQATGLHEVWFRYDDELEYVVRAHRSGFATQQASANSLGGQPVITSVLIDDSGLVQGYRIVTDPRAEPRTRIDAFGLADLFKGLAGLRILCTDAPPAAGEQPVDGVFIKESCELVTDNRITRIESRRYAKPGWSATDPNDDDLASNAFESSARLEVFRPRLPSRLRPGPD